MSVKLRSSIREPRSTTPKGRDDFFGKRQSTASNDVALDVHLPLRNEPGDARVHNRIVPDSRTDPLTSFLDGVIGKNRDIKIFLDVVDARSCGERSRDALYGPGQ